MDQFVVLPLKVKEALFKYLDVNQLGTIDLVTFIQGIQPNRRNN